MPNAPSYAELRKMPMDELVQRYDQHTENRSLGIGFYREEIARREMQEETTAIRQMTRQMRNMTIVITVLTAMNIFLFLCTLSRQG